MQQDGGGRYVSFVFFCLLIASCFLLFFSLRTEILSNSLYSVVAPVHEFSNRVRADIQGIAQYSLKLEQNAAKEQEWETYLFDHALENSFIEEIQKENQELRSLLNYVQRTDYSTTLAQVIAYTPATPQAQFTIDVGESKNIRKNDTVIARVGDEIVLVGKVLTTSFNTAQVLPITNQFSNVLARTVDGNFAGLLTGTGRQLTMRYVDAAARNVVSVGTEIVSSNESNMIVPGILIGEVARVSEDRQNVSLELRVSPFVELASLQYVLVIQQ